MNSIKNIVPSEKGYVIRPFVDLKGQRAPGYMWAIGVRGFWRSFLKCNKQHFALHNTGINFL